MKTLEVTYRGAALRLELEDDTARLFINGIARDKGTLTTSLRLSTTVQTDYELHEFIQGVVTRRDGATEAVLTAGSSEVGRGDLAP